MSSEGLLLALVKEDDRFTREALQSQGVSYADLLKVVQSMREKSGPANTRGAETNYEALMKFGVDFTEKAREGKLDPVIGRDDEIRRAIQILSRRTKNNVRILIKTKVCFVVVVVVEETTAVVVLVVGDEGTTG